MYAVFATGGKQYRASEGDVLHVEKLDAEPGSSVEFDRVLMAGEGDDVRVGTPVLEGGKVSAEVQNHGKGGKIRIVKLRRRKHSRTQQGHRQAYTAIKVTGISG